MERWLRPQIGNLDSRYLGPNRLPLIAWVAMTLVVSSGLLESCGIVPHSTSGSANQSAASTPTPTPSPSPAVTSAATLQAFGSSFYSFAMTVNCAQCHGSVAEGTMITQSPGFAVSDMSTAYANAKPFANFANPSASLLVQYAGNGHCGIATICGNNSSGALAALQIWAAAENAAGAGGQTSTVINRSPLVPDEQTLTLITADIQSQTAVNQPYLRYFTLEAYGNTAGQPTQVGTNTLRAALIKMINLLSTGPKIIQPLAIDSYQLIYRIDLRDLHWTAAAWTNLKATDLYFAPADFASSLATAANQTMRADWFIANIPNSAVNAYFVFLGINSDDPTIDALNGVNRFADMAAGAPATFRAGIAISGTEAFNRILSWHQTTVLGTGAPGAGHLFKSYNMEGDTGSGDIFARPYEPNTNNPSPGGPYNFDFGDSDNIFTLPNGLFGTYTTEPATGAVQTVASQGASYPGPTFCYQCHDDSTFLIQFNDQVHNALLADPVGTFPAAMQTLLLGMYDQSGIQGKMTAAGAQFAAAYAQLNLGSLGVTETPGIGSESMNIVTSNYETLVPVALAAAELGVTPQQLVTGIAKSPSLSATLGSLLTLDSTGNPNGDARRDLWESCYVAVRNILFPQYAQPTPTPIP